MAEVYDLLIIGGGQSGLACAYYLRRTELNYLVLDDRKPVVVRGCKFGSRPKCMDYGK